MFDKDLALELLGQIQNAVEKISNRFQSIHTVRDFTDCPEGSEKMDAICMQLIVMGESLKNLDKITEGKLLRGYPQIDWKKAKGMRDILTHHYADVSAEAVFNTCKEKIPAVGIVIDKIIDDLTRGRP